MRPTWRNPFYKLKVIRRKKNSSEKIHTPLTKHNMGAFAREDTAMGFTKKQERIQGGLQGSKLWDVRGYVCCSDDLSVRVFSCQQRTCSILVLLDVSSVLFIPDFVVRAYKPLLTKSNKCVRESRYSSIGELFEFLQPPAYIRYEAY